MSPLCESFLRADQIRGMEPFFPLRVFACERCYLVQLEAFVAPEEIFTEYAYFSAYSTAWVEHARRYVEMIRARLALGPDDLVVELASNDGYLLQHFVGTGDPDPRDRPGRQRRGRRGGAGRPDAGGVLRPRDGSAAGRRRQAREPDRRQQRARAGPRPQRFRGGCQGAPTRRGARRRSSSRTCFGCSTGFSTTRSTTSTSRTSRSPRSPRSSARTAWTCMTSRSCGPTAAPCASTRSTPTVRTSRRLRSPSCSHARSREGLLSPERYARFADDVKESKRALLDLLIRAPSREQAGRRLRSAGQGKHASELLRNPHGPPGLHGRPQPVQARPVHAGHAHPDLPAREDRGDAARLRPRPAVEPRRRDRRAARLREGVGRPADRPRPGRKRTGSLTTPRVLGRNV